MFAPTGRPEARTAPPRGSEHRNSASVGVDIRADDAIRYRVEIAAPSDVAASLRSAVDLIRWQDFEDMTEDLFERLARDAVPQAKEAAATQGYFSADVDVRVDRSAKPVRRAISS